MPDRAVRLLIVHLSICEDFGDAGGVIPAGHPETMLAELRMAIVWRNKMSIDHGTIDNDHKCLIRLVNDVEVIRPGPGLPKQVAEILERLDAYAHAHFEREEQLQSSVTFPQAQDHHERHVALMGELHAMRAEWEQARAPRDMVTFRAHLCDFLYHWLVGHIVKHDLLMRPYVAEMQRHAKEPVPLDDWVAALGAPALRSASGT
jgi:hemerythrin